MTLSKPILLIFLDGLKPENVDKLEILQSLPYKGRIRGKYGYSIACHGSMYTGKEVSEHKNWFVWQRRVGQGYLRHKIWRLRVFNTLVFRLLWHKFLIRKERHSNSSFFGIPRVVNLRTKDLSDLLVTERMNYNEYGYMENEKSFLDKFIDKGYSIDFVGFSKKYKEESDILKEWSPKEKFDITYWFLGDVDHFSHKYGQDSAEAKNCFNNLNKILLDAMNTYRSYYQEEPLILAWSDHGHAMINRFTDIYGVEELKPILANTAHVVDATSIRLWKSFEDDTCWAKKINAFDKHLCPISDKLGIQEMKQSNLWPGDNRFGDVVYMLLKGECFKRTIWGFSSDVVSQHGYNPNDPELDGFYASNIIQSESDTSEINRIHDWALDLLNVASGKIAP